MTKVGLIAGGGRLPVTLAEHCRAEGRPYYVIRLAGLAEAALCSHPGAEAGLAEVGRILRLARDADCEALCLAGVVRRPDFARLKPDLRGLAVLPGAVRAARDGDEALLRYIAGELRKEGFVIEGAHEVMHGLAIGVGPLGAARPGPEHVQDMRRAIEVARAVGSLDIGQGAVVCDGLVLAVEAQEGTEAMLRRVGELPAAIRGRAGARRGVLAKAPKPIQDERVDMPAIGEETVKDAARAGLAGIAGVAGRLLVIDRAAVIAAADAAGLFVTGVADP